MSAFTQIEETLKSSDNEATCSPYWMIVDPSAVTGSVMGEDEDGNKYEADIGDELIERLVDMIPHCITGPFFSRESANEHLKARRYAFSKSTYVYCFSGYASPQYKAAYRSLKP